MIKEYIFDINLAINQKVYWYFILFKNQIKNMKTTISKFLLLVAFGLSSFIAKAQTADEIIDKYIAEIGGKEKWRQVKSMVIEGQIEVQGLEIPFTQKSIMNVGVRVDAEFQGQKIIDITTPKAGWAQNPLAGKTTLQPLTTEELKDKLDELDIQDDFVDYKEKGSTVEYLGKDEEDGNEYHKIKLTTKNEKETTYFFDLKTNLIYKQESVSKQQGQDVKLVSKSLNYQTTDFGIKVPFKVDMGMMMNVIKKITINSTIDESIFKGN